MYFYMKKLKNEAGEVIGRPGGIARAKKLSKARRVAIAKLAAKVRWANRNR